MYEDHNPDQGDQQGIKGGESWKTSRAASPDDKVGGEILQHKVFLASQFGFKFL